VLGGTNLYGVVFQGGSKHKSFIINKLCFVISSLRGLWRFVPPNTATSQPRFPAKGRINCAAPFKSFQGDLYPHGYNTQIKSALTINPWDHPRDKVSNPCYSAPPQSSAATPERFLLIRSATSGGGSVVFADDWQELLHALSQSSPHN
jgi:hypothetical protein